MNKCFIIILYVDEGSEELFTFCMVSIFRKRFRTEWFRKFVCNFNLTGVYLVLLRFVLSPIMQQISEWIGIFNLTPIPSYVTVRGAMSDSQESESSRVLFIKVSSWCTKYKPPHDKTSKMTVRQVKTRSAWASAQSDQSLHCALNG